MPRLLTSEEIERQLDDLPGWVALEYSLHARYDAVTFPDAIAFIADIAEEAEEMDHHPDIDSRWRTVHLGLWTHSVDGITQLDFELAHRIVALAHRRGVIAQPTAPSVLELAIDTVDATAIRDFWRVGLNLKLSGETLVDPTGKHPNIWFQPMEPERNERNRIHLDIYLTPDQITGSGGRLAAVLDAGGRLVDDSHAPAWWVLADADGNELCLCTSRRDPTK